MFLISGPGQRSISGILLVNAQNEVPSGPPDWPVSVSSPRFRGWLQSWIGLELQYYPVQPNAVINNAEPRC